MSMAHFPCLASILGGFSGKRGQNVSDVVEREEQQVFQGLLGQVVFFRGKVCVQVIVRPHARAQYKSHVTTLTTIVVFIDTMYQ